MNPDPAAGEQPSSSDAIAKNRDCVGQQPTVPIQSQPSKADGLSKEEQWALFEKELKESDWGHQPC